MKQFLFVVLAALLVVVPCVATSAGNSRSAILSMACSGEVQSAFSKLKSFKKSDLAKDAGLLHIRSALEYILNANNTRAVALHKQGKAVDGKLIPPLADFYLKGQPCAGLSDIFYLSAVNIKQLVDSDLALEQQLEGHKTLIKLLSDTGLSRAAEKHLRAALALDPADASLLFHAALMTPVVYESREHVLETRALLQARMRNLSAVEELSLPALDDFSLPPSFYLVYQGFDDKHFLSELYSNYARAYKALDDSASISFPERERLRPIRVGFVSSHLRRHSICKLFCSIIQHLNDHSSSAHVESPFEIYIFSTAPQTKEDAHTAAVRDRCGSVTTLGPRGAVAKNESGPPPHDSQAPPFVEFVRMEKSVISNRNAVRDREIDLLVFLDIGMDPANLMWAATRLAPVQIVTWGHPSTSGLPHIDYFISSELFYEMSNRNIATEAQDENKQVFNLVSSDSYSEQLILLSSLGMYFNRPKLLGHGDEEISAELLASRPARFFESLRRRHAGNVDVSRLLDIKAESLTAELPARVVLCPQQLPKFHPNFDDFIRSTLELNPQTLFVVIHDPKSKYQWQRTLKQRWSKAFELSAEKGQQASAVLSDRILWLGRLDPQEYLAVVACGDVMVDPYPFGGGVTTMEALAVCTPVVTLPLQTVPALTAGMLTQLFRGDGALDDDARDADHYLNILIAKSESDLARNIETLLDNQGDVTSTLRLEICRRSDNIFEQKSAPQEWALLLNKLASQHLHNRSTSSTK